MALSTLTIRVDENDNIDCFLHDEKSPFEIYVNDPFFSAENQKALMEADRQIREGKVVRKSMDELEAMENE